MTTAPNDSGAAAEPPAEAITDPAELAAAFHRLRGRWSDDRPSEQLAADHPSRLARDVRRR